MTNPTEADYQAAREIYRKPQGLARASMASYGLNEDGIAEIIAKHMAAERERAERLEAALKKLLMAARESRTGWMGPGVLAEHEAEARAALEGK